MAAGLGLDATGIDLAPGGRRTPPGTRHASGAARRGFSVTTPGTWPPSPGP